MFVLPVSLKVMSCWQFFIRAEINFGRLPLSLSLSVCLEEEGDKSDKFFLLSVGAKWSAEKGKYIYGC